MSSSGDSVQHGTSQSRIIKNEENAGTIRVRRSLQKMVGAKGFEPSTSWSRTRRASQAALRPDKCAHPHLA
jgi:hypothetical protein